MTARPLPTALALAIAAFSLGAQALPITLRAGDSAVVNFDFGFTSPRQLQTIAGTLGYLLAGIDPGDRLADIEVFKDPDAQNEFGTWSGIVASGVRYSYSPGNGFPDVSGLEDGLYSVRFTVLAGELDLTRVVSSLNFASGGGTDDILGTLGVVTRAPLDVPAPATPVLAALGLALLARRRTAALA